MGLETQVVEESFPHLPVLYQEIIEALHPESEKRYLDGTLGAGGHAFGILSECSPDGSLLGLDVDEQALTIARNRLVDFGERIHIRKGSYLDADKHALEIGWNSFDGIVIDLGCSSMQLNQAERGFSFRKKAKLDMRFDQSKGVTAEELINTIDEGALSDLIWRYGEERHARRIAKAIIKRRPINTTDELAAIVRQATGKQFQKIDPATRTFQALRIAVNQELETLEKALPLLNALLNSKGRLAIISFHSLEDRLVKNFFNRESKDCICPPDQPVCTCKHQRSLNVLTKKPIRPSEAEIRANPRARSARLRIAEKI